MNKGLTIAGGAITGIFVLLAVVGGALSGFAGENLENIDDDPSPYYTESENGSATFNYVDDDRKGSLAFQVLLRLDYVDNDEDGFVDGCVDYNVTVTDEDGTDVTDDVIEIYGCGFDVFEYEDPIHDGLVVSTYVCETWMSNADCTINSNYTVSVTDSNNDSVDFILFENDAYTVGLMKAGAEDFGSLMGGIGLSSLACCCGIPIGLILLIIGLAIGGDPPQPMMVQQAYTPIPSVGSSPVVGQMQAPVGQMQAPVGQMQAPVGQMAPPISTPVQDSTAPESQN